MTPSPVKKPWTDEELGILQDHEHLSARELGEFMGRGMQSVQHKRRQLRLGLVNKRTFWTEDEIDVVRDTPHLSAVQVAKSIGRSRSSVEYMRQALADAEGLSFGRGDHKNPNHPGKRRLLAKTCKACGFLLDASWFSWSTDGKGNPRSWKARCNKCHAKSAADNGWKRSGHSKDGGSSAKKSYIKMQEITRQHATRHGQPWVESDHETLRDADLTTFEKAIQLGRTWAATHMAVSQNGYQSKVGRGDPAKGQWIIENPNGEWMAMAA